MGVTIGIPFYNAGQYLEMAIKSVFAQSYQDWELFLIDDGSSDNSLEIARAIKDPRVHVLSDGKNKKLAARLNEIIRLANYEYIVRMDADDLMDTTRIATQLNFLKSNPHLDLLSTGCISTTNNLEYLGSRGLDLPKIDFNDLLYKKAGPLHASIVGKTDWFRRNTYDESLQIAQDYDLWLRASKKGDFAIALIPDRLYYYREENNATAKKVLAAYKNERVMYKKYAGRAYYKRWLNSKARSLIVWTIAGLNKEDLLLKRRSRREMNPNERNHYLEQIKLIQNTLLPK